MRIRPIGVFDSGVGGISVLREIRRLLPAEDLVYVADSRHAPYGDKSAAFVRRRSETISAFLVRQDVKAIVVACNTATGLAIEGLRSRFDMPIVGIEPAVKPAAAATHSGRVAVLATTGTLASGRFAALVAHHARHVQVLSQPCPGLVEQVEAGDLTGPATRALLEGYVRPLVAQGADTIVLGCTHYSFLAPLIREVAGPEVAIVDPAAAVAEELGRRLRVHQLHAPLDRVGRTRVVTTGSARHTRETLARLWPGPARVRR
jgi:glutamate racemase